MSRVLIREPINNHGTGDVNKASVQNGTFFNGRNYT